MNLEVTRDTKLQVLHFLLQNIHVCIDITHINKVLSLAMIQAIPGSPNYLVGAINFAGHSIPVIDLAVYFGMQRTQHYSLDTPILCCSDEVHQLGLIVDKIVGLVNVAGSALQMHSEFDNPASPFIGTISLNNELSLLVNFNKLLVDTATFAENKIPFNANVMELSRHVDR